MQVEFFSFTIKNKTGLETQPLAYTLEHLTRRDACRLHALLSVELQTSCPIAVSELLQCLHLFFAAFTLDQVSRAKFGLDQIKFINSNHKNQNNQ